MLHHKDTYDNEPNTRTQPWNAKLTVKFIKHHIDMSKNLNVSML